MSDNHYPSLIGWLHAFIGGGATTLLAAAIGRMVYHGQEVKAGRRPVLGKHLLWEAPIAVFMAVVAKALSAWMGLPPTVATGVVAMVAYLGPRGAMELIGRLFGPRRW